MMILREMQLVLFLGTSGFIPAAEGAHKHRRDTGSDRLRASSHFLARDARMFLFLYHHQSHKVHMIRAIIYHILITIRCASRLNGKQLHGAVKQRVGEIPRSPALSC